MTKRIYNYFSGGTPTLREAIKITGLTEEELLEIKGLEIHAPKYDPKDWENHNGIFFPITKKRGDK